MGVCIPTVGMQTNEPQKGTNHADCDCEDSYVSIRYQVNDLHATDHTQRNRQCYLGAKSVMSLLCIVASVDSTEGKTEKFGKTEHKAYCYPCFTRGHRYQPVQRVTVVPITLWG